MSQFLPYTTSFILDKAHFSECFDQSARSKGIKDYTKAGILFIVGLILLFVVGTNHYAAFFVVALAAIEALSVYYKKTWWLWRQMLSKAYDHKVDLEINEQGVTTSSFHVNSQLDWDDVGRVENTEVGLLLHHKGGVNYLSNGYLSDEVIEFIKDKC